MLGSLLGFVNVQLGLFNLIPGFPLDGGRALRAGLWAWGKDFYRATVQASFVGQAFGVMLGLAGVMVVIGALSGDLPESMAANGGWVVILATFLFATDLTSRRQAVVRQSLAAVPVRDLRAARQSSAAWGASPRQEFPNSGGGPAQVIRALS